VQLALVRVRVRVMDRVIVRVIVRVVDMMCILWQTKLQFIYMQHPHTHRQKYFGHATCGTCGTALQQKTEN